MKLFVQFCYHKDTKWKSMAITHIPKGTELLWYDGEVVRTAKAKTHSKEGQTHLLTLKGTGCSVDGSFDILFPNKREPSVDDKFTIPCNLMSLTNSSRGDRSPNFMMKIKKTKMLYWNDLMMPMTAWLVASENILPGEEIFCDYPFVH